MLLNHMGNHSSLIINQIQLISWIIMNLSAIIPILFYHCIINDTFWELSEFNVTKIGHMHCIFILNQSYSKLVLSLFIVAIQRMQSTIDYGNIVNIQNFLKSLSLESIDD